MFQSLFRQRLALVPPSPRNNPLLFLLLSRHSNAQTKSTGGGLPLLFTGVRLLFPANSKLNSVELVRKEEPLLRIPLVWLRDHCRCARCYDQGTGQRKSDCTDLFRSAELSTISEPVLFDRERQRLTVNWLGNHQSSFSVANLAGLGLVPSANTRARVQQVSAEDGDQWDEGNCMSRTLWTGDTLKEVPSVSSKNFDFALFARLFVRFGLVSVDGLDSRGGTATRQLCESLAPIRNTFFGDFWTFGHGQQRDDMAAFDDSAYGSEGIGPHTDCTYLEQPPGIQVFHCLKAATKGGQTLLVDGFSVAQKMRQQRPDLFAALAGTNVESEYLERSTAALGDGGQWLLHAKAQGTVIRRMAGQEKLAQIRFNPYDRAPFKSLRLMEDEPRNECLDISERERRANAAFEESVLFYEAYQHFAQLASSADQQLQIQLRPGTAIFIDNFRVLHGRKAFQGERVICGCYLCRDTFLARARPLLSPRLYKNV